MGESQAIRENKNCVITQILRYLSILFRKSKTMKFVNSLILFQALILCSFQTIGQSYPFDILPNSTPETISKKYKIELSAIQFSNKAYRVYDFNQYMLINGIVFTSGTIRFENNIVKKSPSEFKRSGVMIVYIITSLKSIKKVKKRILSSITPLHFHSINLASSDRYN